MEITFDKAYFDAIWGTLHRHDYCDTLSDILIQKYGRVRILDIGTGCGYLVKMLREKGCDAWGLETSSYAVENSCAPSFIRHGSVLDIPYAKNSFEVVFSQGLWEYVAEQDIQQAWQECQRVGQEQEHNIDTTQDTGFWTKDFATYKSAEWWKNTLYPKILIACPNHEMKEYSFQRWIDNVKKLTYPNVDILVVDNSADESFMNRWKSQVPMVHIDTEQGDETGKPGIRICQAMERIREEFLTGGYAYWFNLESDVIPPPGVIEYLLAHGKDADWISHGYPQRGAEGYTQGIGCSLFNRKIIEENDFISGNMEMGGDGNFWDKIWRQGLKWKTAELYFFLDIMHLAE